MILLVVLPSSFASLSTVSLEGFAVYDSVIEATISSSKLGFKGKIGKFKIDEIAKEILNIAKFGLQSRQQLNSSGDNETGYLAPLFSMVENKKTLADEMLENYSSIWNKNCILYTSPSPRDATISRKHSYA